MLIQRALRLDVLSRGARRCELGLRARYIEVRSNAAGVTAHRQLQGMLIGGDRVREDLLLFIESAQIEVGVGQTRLQAQAYGSEIGVGSLCCRAACADFIAYAAPQIEVVVDADVDGIRSIDRWLIRATQRPVVGLPVA